MKQILITGATGNIGQEVIKHLFQQNTDHQVIAGVRDPAKASWLKKEYPKLQLRTFDFEQPETYTAALKEIDRIFLLRPPQLASVKKYFVPLLSQMKSAQINQVIFLSVQGVETSKVIPHHKIEQLIKQNELQYCFIRPGYFMQNLTTTLYQDIQNKRKIILPAGKARFNWVDGENIGEVAARVLHEFEHYKNQAFDLTGYEPTDFYQVTRMINEVIQHPIHYQSVNPLKFYQIKKKEGVNKGMIMVMIMLHFLPRFQKDPEISTKFEEITGRKPATLKEFIQREKFKFEI